ncbi:MAG: hypothetical protein ACYTEU_11320 [Planctomycetota bacterium]
MTEPIRDCPDCGVRPGEMHLNNCDVEQCSACGYQRLQCDCKEHDPAFSRWSGWWPGSLEAEALGLDLNQFHIEGYGMKLFKKPDSEKRIKEQIEMYEDEIAQFQKKVSKLKNILRN